jgi:hypothetical protein
MSHHKKYNQPQVTAEQVAKKLNGASPLQASRVLIDMELHDQSAALDIIDSIYADLASKQNVIDELVTPLGLSVLDSVISHKDLQLNRTGLTASRLWSDVQSFAYTSEKINSQTLSAKQQLEGIRQVSPGKRANVQKHKLDAHKVKHTGKDGTIKNELDGAKLYRQGMGSSTKDTVNTEHLESSEAYHRKFANNVFLSDADMKIIVNHDNNLASISERQNKMKLDGTFKDIKQRKERLLAKQQRSQLTKHEQAQLSFINESFSAEALETGIGLEQEATNANFKASQDSALNSIRNDKSKVLAKASSQAGEQTGYQALGHAVLLMIKPILHEINDSIKNGIDSGVGKDSTLEGLKYRLERVFNYIRTEIVPTLKQGLKDFFNNFCKVIIDSIIGLATGIFKSLMRILIEGFSALVGAFKILSKPSNEMTSAQKADAILKLFASTVVTFVIFYFESSILPAIPIAFMRDIALALLSGVASALVVYALDKADIFSTQAELRTQRIKEVFEMRILQIKQNTDAFATTSLEKLAKDKLEFRALADKLIQDIDTEQNANGAVYDIADFLKIELSVKSTDEFLDLLLKQDKLVIA